MAKKAASLHPRRLPSPVPNSGLRMDQKQLPEQKQHHSRRWNGAWKNYSNPHLPKLHFFLRKRWRAFPCDLPRERGSQLGNYSHITSSWKNATNGRLNSTPWFTWEIKKAVKSCKERRYTFTKKQKRQKRWRPRATSSILWSQATRSRWTT